MSCSYKDFSKNVNTRLFVSKAQLSTSKICYHLSKDRQQEAEHARDSKYIILLSSYHFHITRLSRESLFIP